jgi:ABC-type nitrate/sulfonate/bicarbonate transport system permease component
MSLAGGTARRLSRVYGGYVLGFASMFLIWHLASVYLVSSVLFPPPAAVFRKGVALARNGVLLEHLSASVQRILTGFIAGSLLGIPIGLAMGSFRPVRKLLEPYTEFLRFIPSVAMITVAVIWFGIGEGSKIATLAFGVFFPTVIATAGGVDNVPRGLIRMGQSFGLSRWSIIRKIVLPAALPAILSGFRVTSSIAIVLLVAAEMIGAERGIGAFVLSAGNLYDTDNLLAGIVVLSVLGLLVSWVIGRLERWFLAWRS